MRVLLLLMMLTPLCFGCEDTEGEGPATEESREDETPEVDPLWAAYATEAEQVKLRYYLVSAAAFDDAEHPGIAAHNKARQVLSELREGAEWDVVTAPLSELEGGSISETDWFHRLAPPPIEGLDGDVRDVLIREAFGLSAERPYPYEPLEIGAEPAPPTYLVIGLADRREPSEAGLTDDIRECLTAHIEANPAGSESGCMP